MSRIILPLTVLLILFSCKTQQKTDGITSNTQLETPADHDDPALEMEHRALDTMVISAPRMDDFDGDSGDPARVAPLGAA